MSIDITMQEHMSNGASYYVEMILLAIYNYVKLLLTLFIVH